MPFSVSIYPPPLSLFFSLSLFLFIDSHQLINFSFVPLSLFLIPFSLAPLLFVTPVSLIPVWPPLSHLFHPLSLILLSLTSLSHLFPHPLSHPSFSFVSLSLSLSLTHFSLIPSFLFVPSLSLIPLSHPYFLICFPPSHSLLSLSLTPLSLSLSLICSPYLSHPSLSLSLILSLSLPSISLCFCFSLSSFLILHHISMPYHRNPFLPQSFMISFSLPVQLLFPRWNIV